MFSFFPKSFTFRTSLFPCKKLFISIRWNGVNNKLPPKGFSSMIASKSGTQSVPINRELLVSSSSVCNSIKSPLPFNQLTSVRGVTKIGLYQKYEEKTNYGGY